MFPIQNWKLSYGALHRTTYTKFLSLSLTVLIIIFKLLKAVNILEKKSIMLLLYRRFKMLNKGVIATL